MDGLMTFCHDARKGRYIGSHWPNHVRASALLDQSPRPHSRRSGFAVDFRKVQMPENGIQSGCTEPRDSAVKGGGGVGRGPKTAVADGLR